MDYLKNYLYAFFYFFYICQEYVCVYIYIYTNILIYQFFCFIVMFAVLEIFAYHIIDM